ncbi:NAD-dependent protein deacylase [Fructilactobacillus fructivorans]|uniref:protein acetyllysine N-acetyltransferase n=1 Tax=Fructilactobacillus fructivorans TaxID=1614 RepID=A0A0C1PM91_9LACO|nr:NAD-dependent protein deacylase [Fructilactobacillus fructivorans]KID41061.1 NAD-dependent protein deacetylase of SIR2 family [Fructilactobacillus fructivorans]MCT0151433.1 NAD-dependent protein deacylase [Fructilactobacillus fructivorans]MCT2866952.1 NAD-dependent protein deacylase [Fructilactobacillus fructivorans]MCT2869253.1 NAD-dependent protein deacylase [Fructilactobacillus fructivorans]MCT2873710.1 NAD-dependent protein deacylase [Fructilactobacillus fructivorans]
MNQDNIQEKFNNAKNIVFLTGAGISTPSGIPDYRSKGGLYTNDKSNKPAEYYLSHDCLVNEPEVFYEYVKKNMYYPDAKPNVIHEKQAELTRQNRASIITQNVDNLYEKADAKNLNEFHGNLYHIYCQKCGKHVDYHEYMKSMYHKNCGGILRPNIVLYGEGINTQTVENSVRLMSQSDLIVIVGTSMRVYPFAGLLDYRNPNADVIAINQEALHFDFPFTMVKEDAVDFFDKLKV